MTDDRRLDLETARRPTAGPEIGGKLAAAHVVSPVVIQRRRRLIHLIGLVTFLGGIGLSAIPGPKGSADAVSQVKENGVTTTVHKFSYYRPYGAPFPVARAEFNETGGGIKRFEMTGDGAFGIFANMAVAFALALGASLLLGRRRDP